MPFVGGDFFNHEADDVTVTIPFSRDGSNGTVRITVGVDGQATVIALSGNGESAAQATVLRDLPYFCRPLERAQQSPQSALHLLQPTVRSPKGTDCFDLTNSKRHFC